MGIENYKSLYAKYQHLRAKSNKSALEVAEFEFLSYLVSFLSCVEAFNTKSRVFTRKVDRSNFLDIAQKMVKNFQHNEEWLRNEGEE